MGIPTTSCVHNIHKHRALSLYIHILGNESKPCARRPAPTTTGLVTYLLSRLVACRECGPRPCSIPLVLTPLLYVYIYRCILFFCIFPMTPNMLHLLLVGKCSCKKTWFASLATKTGACHLGHEPGSALLPFTTPNCPFVRKFGHGSRQLGVSENWDAPRTIWLPVSGCRP